LEDLHDIVDSNDIENFDPVEEAFKLYDPDNVGFIDKVRLKDVFLAYGFEDMTTADTEILAKAADIDGDGKITLEDFRKMLNDPEATLMSHVVQKRT
jgi:Ca2+-binding EF-hand superfamily protein